ncbi:flavodoxin [Faecalicatena orotica]|uniref:flavodoxin n=1 Tax=Faecalicatena orotica TaxID=1544 RepID=UPI0031DAB54B
MKSKKMLVTYFSASGETAKLAKKLAETVGADLFEIKPEVPYTSADLDWMNKKSRSSMEMNDKNSRPGIASKVTDLNAYDVVFIGFPIWWYVAPTIINTFLESYDFSGKTVVTFATSGGSGMGNTDKVLKELCPNSVIWKKGKRFHANAGKSELENWVKELEL